MSAQPLQTALAIATAALCPFTAGCERAVPIHAPESSAAVERTWRTGDAAGRDRLVVRLTLDRTSLSVADRLRLELAIGLAPGERTTFAPPTETLGDFTIVEHSSTGPAPAALDPAGLSWTEHRYLLEPFLAGDKRIPAFSVPLAGPRAGDGEPTGVTTEPVTVVVTSTLPAEPADLTLAPARGPVALAAVPERDDRVWWIAAGVVTAGLAAAAAVAGLRARPARIDHVARAVTALSSLRAAAIDAQDDAGHRAPNDEATRNLASDAADALRRYVQDHLGVPAADRTTQELLADPRLAHRIGPGPSDLLRTLLASLDRLRFDRSPERGVDLRDVLRDGERFIDLTRAPAAPPATTAPLAPAPAAALPPPEVTR